MRPYRAIPIDGKDFVYGWYWYNDATDKHYIRQTNFQPAKYDYTDYRVIPETVGQSTDLKDKNKEAYKSDIIEGIHKTTKEVIVGEVVWDDGAFQWGVQLDSWVMNFPCLISCYDWEIIGDIHTTPKLLEKSK